MASSMALCHRSNGHWSKGAMEQWSNGTTEGPRLRTRRQQAPHRLRFRCASKAEDPRLRNAIRHGSCAIDMFSRQRALQRLGNVTLGRWLLPRARRLHRSFRELRRTALYASSKYRSPCNALRANTQRLQRASRCSRLARSPYVSLRIAWEEPFISCDARCWMWEARSRTASSSPAPPSSLSSDERRLAVR